MATLPDTSQVMEKLVQAGDDQEILSHDCTDISAYDLLR